MQEKVKQLRLGIDGIAQLVKELQPTQGFIIDVAKIPQGWDLEKVVEIFKKTNYGVIDSSSTSEEKIPKNTFTPINANKEIAKAYDSLIFAKAWLGKVMGELGVASPYKSGYKTKEDIEPTADVADKALPDFLTIKGDFNTLNHIEKVDYLRVSIDDLVKAVKNLNYTEMMGQPSREFAIARTNSYNHLCEARFWLGFELQRIKEA